MWRNENYLLLKLNLKFCSRVFVLRAPPSSLVSIATQTISCYKTMSSEFISEFYASVCAEHEIQINPHVSQVLGETPVTE